MVDIYGGQDPERLPIYTFADASRYLDIPATTVRYWAKGGIYTREEERRIFAPILMSGSSEEPFEGLSFLNLTELFVLKALRRKHNVQLRKIRWALEFAERELGIDRLLLSDLHTYGGNVFIKHYGDMINLPGGQITLEKILDRYLKRVDRDARKVPITLYPIIEDLGDERPVSIDPRVLFGKPTVTGTGIHTAVIAERYRSGEGIEQLASDYRLDPDLITGALMYEKAA
jgi:uncharacterized protein (DUF433 family)